MLVAIKRDRFRATEGALKYFLLGAFASGVLLYGIAWLFGLTGTTNLANIALYVQSQGADNPWFLLGLGLLLVGLAFKVAAVPFHMWTPDAYQGAPTPSTAFLAAGAKMGAMAGLLRVVVHGLEPWQDMVLPIVIAIAVASMIVGNFVAIWQRDVKRLLAYSSIAHTGYMLVGIAVVHAHSEAGGLMRDAVAAVMFYAVVYALMTLGAFAVTFAVERRTDGTDLENFQNLGRSSPLMAVAMAIFMISLTGIPPAAGFFGKLYSAASGRQRRSDVGGGGPGAYEYSLGLLLSARGREYVHGRHSAPPAAGARFHGYWRRGCHWHDRHARARHLSRWRR